MSNAELLAFLDYLRRRAESLREEISDGIDGEAALWFAEFEAQNEVPELAAIWDTRQVVEAVLCWRLRKGGAA